MGAGRPQKVHPGALYAVAHQFYWDFRRLSEGGVRWRFDRNKNEQLMLQAETAEIQLSDDQIASARQAVEKETADGRLKESEREKRLRDVEEGLMFATRASLFLDAAEQS